MIKFSDIQIKFGNFTAIDHLNLEVNKGEFFTFSGTFRLRKDDDPSFTGRFHYPDEG